MKTKPIPPIHETSCIAYWNIPPVILGISYDTDSTYLFVSDIPVIEFTANCDVLNVLDPHNPSLIGRLRTPKGYAFGTALEFVSTQHVSPTGFPSCSILYVDKHVDIFLRFETALCKMLTTPENKEGDYCLLKAFMRNWDEFKQLNPSHKSLTITFN